MQNLHFSHTQKKKKKKKKNGTKKKKRKRKKLYVFVANSHRMDWCSLQYLEFIIFNLTLFWFLLAFMKFLGYHYWLVRKLPFQEPKRMWHSKDKALLQLQLHGMTLPILHMAHHLVARFKFTPLTLLPRT